MGRLYDVCMHGLVLRTMRVTEVDEVAAVWWRSQVESAPWLRLEERYTWKESLAYFRDVIVQACDVWVAETSDEVVAMMAVKGDELDRLYVATNTQRQGIGTARLDHAKALRPGGLRVVTLQRNAGARRFYERRGFVAYATGFSPPPESQPDIWYRWPS
jgi:ribosomal protein S18 acetylase RimI-like enzyme